MSNKVYVGISGKMGSGKTTLTEGLKEVLSGSSVDVVSLAAPIKAVQDQIYKDLELVMEGEKDRDLLIALGMWGRNKDSGFWLKQAVKKFESSEADVVICDDVRFPNEAAWFRDHGVLIRLEGEQRGPNVDPKRKDDGTEVALDNYPFENIIDNKTIEFTLLTTLNILAKHLGVHEDISRGLVEKVKEG